MYTVQKLAPNTTLEITEIRDVPGWKAAGLRSPNSITWGVVDEDGKVHKGEHGIYDVFGTKKVAQMQADYLNGQ